MHTHVQTYICTCLPAASPEGGGLTGSQPGEAAGSAGLSEGMFPNCNMTRPISTQREVEHDSSRAKSAQTARPGRAVPADIMLLLSDITELWACSVRTSGGPAQLFRVISLVQENIRQISSHISKAVCKCVSIEIKRNLTFHG